MRSVVKGDVAWRNVERTSKKVFIPLTVGGGLRTVDDIQSVLRKGADKVSLNTAAIRNPKLIQEASRKFGSSTIVVSIEAIRKTDGTYEAYTDNGREKTGINAFEWALQVAELGAGEIMVTSIDREGTGKGFDLELTKKISEAISIPVIACGGAGTLNHISDAIIKGKADAVSLASMIHYRFTQQFEHKDDYYVEGNTDFLQKKRLFSERHTVSIMEIKEYLVGQSINCSNNIPGYKNI